MIDATRPRPVRHPSAPSATAHDNQGLAAAAAALTPTPPGRALFGTDTSGLAQSYILYSGREVLPIGGFLGNVSASALATLQADISCGYMRVFVLAVSPQARTRGSGGSNRTAPGSPQPQPDRSPPCRGKPQGAGPDIPDASRTPPPPGCRCEQSPPRGPAVHVYSSRAREPGSPCPGPSPIGSASRRQPTCRGTEVSGQVQRAGGGGQA